MLTNIRKSDTTCKLITQAGEGETDLIGDFPGFPKPVWLKEDGVANLIPLNDLTQAPGFSVHMNTNVENAITVITNSGRSFKFLPCGKGLYHHDWTPYLTARSRRDQIANDNSE